MNNDSYDLDTKPADTLSTELINLLSVLSDIESFLGIVPNGEVCGPEKVKPTLISKNIETVRHLRDQAERIRKELIGKL